jgi:ankyrin repeat protein
MKIFYILLVLLSNAYAFSQEDTFSLVRSGDLDKLSSVLKSEPDLIDLPNKDGFTMLILAAYKGHDEIVDFLLNVGANVNYNSEMGTALTAAVFRGNYKMSQNLLNNKANPNLTDLKGVTPLMYAIQFKNKDLIKLLLKYNSDKKLLDSTGKTAFEYAINSKDEEIIDILK